MTGQWWQGKVLWRRSYDRARKRALSSSRSIPHRLNRSSRTPSPTDVFLSFRGVNTRGTFTAFLYDYLKSAEIEVFIDENSLQRGDDISPSLLQAIQLSTISIIIFSKNYADSKSCLQELEKIMECRRTKGQIALPVFYGVDPSEVRHQKGSFGEGFKDLINKISPTQEEISRWTTALHEAAGIAGFVVVNSSNESQDVKNIVKRVSSLLDKTALPLPDHPVGLESHAQDLIKLLKIHPPNEVLIVGIWGMGGSGKTTISKAIYNKLGRKFEVKSFLSNIRQAWEKDNGHVCLQQLLWDINKIEMKIHSIEWGIDLLQKKLPHKKVLLVLDDVDKSEQLDALCKSRQWFGSGSRIIITTRDKRLLDTLKADDVYRMKDMDDNDSLELFSWHAFRQARPKEDFTQLSKNVVAYCGGLPLALEVLGAYLFDRGTIEWKSVLEKLKKIPNKEIQQKLEISFDGLSDDMEKDIFLDISCFFIGMDRNDVTQILNGCGFFADIGISVLIERSLVKVDEKNKLRMHDLLQSMGREIIRRKKPNNPEERSRLWSHEEVLHVLLEHTGTKAVEGLALQLLRTNIVRLNTKAFENMKRLRLLQLGHVQLAGDYKNLSGDLKWLCWHGSTLTYIPSNFYQQNLVFIELKYSYLKLVWKEPQLLEKLKVLNLSHSHYLTCTPDFSLLPSLEKLILKDCPSLSVVHYTIGRLNKLLLINLEDCKCLCSLPRSIYELKSLETLILSGCSMIEKLEEDLAQMESLRILIADRTAITQVPFSLTRSERIWYISLCGYEGLACDVIPSIIWSWMSPSINSLSLNCQTFESLSSIDMLNNSFYDLSSTLNDLPKVRSFKVLYGTELQLSEEVRRILDVLYAANYKELGTITDTSKVSDTESSTSINCRSQALSSRFENSLICPLPQKGMSDQVNDTLQESILQGFMTNESNDFFLGQNNHRFAYEGMGPSVKFQVPQVNGCKLKGMTLRLIHLSSPGNPASKCPNNVLIVNYTKKTLQIYKQDTVTFFDDEEWESITSNLGPGDEVEVIVVFGSGITVKKTIIYLTYGDLVDEKMKPSPEVNNVRESVDEKMKSSPEVNNVRETVDEKMKPAPVVNNDRQSGNSRKKIHVRNLFKCFSTC